MLYKEIRLKYEGVGFSTGRKRFKDEGTRVFGKKGRESSKMMQTSNPNKFKNPSTSVVRTSINTVRAVFLVLFLSASDK